MNKLIKKLSVSIIAASVLVLAAGLLAPAPTEAGFDKNYLIDDAKFESTGAMSVEAIQAFLNARGGFLKDWVDNVDMVQPNGCYAHRATGMTAAQVIWQAANQWGAQTVSCDGQTVNYWSNISGYTMPTVSPEVLLVTLQKEQSLLTATGGYSTNPGDYVNPACCSSNQYKLKWAMGYGVPDSGSLLHSKMGFYNQINWAAWQLRFNYERSGGNTAWDNVGHINYGGPMTAGTHKRCASCSLQTFDGYYPIDGTPLYMGNRATASLYYYTPHTYPPYHGNYNFVNFYETYFGPVHGSPCTGGTNISGPGAGAKVVANSYFPHGNSQLTLTMLNDTGSKCIEAHTWNNSTQGWLSNVATNHHSTQPGDGEIITADLNSDLKSELIFVKYANTGSGKIELHIWDSSYQRWLANIATNHPTITPGTGQVVAADINGDLIDELHFVKYAGTGSGQIEVHTWFEGYQNWYSNIATAHPVITPGNGNVVAGNYYGDRRDEFHFVKYASTGSGNIEIHTWAPGFQSWLSNYATNHPAITPGDGEVITADQNGNHWYEFVFVKYKNTGSGQVEVHTWNPGFQSWVSNAATNHPDF